MVDGGRAASTNAVAEMRFVILLFNPLIDQKIECQQKVK